MKDKMIRPNNKMRPLYKELTYEKLSAFIEENLREDKNFSKLFWDDFHYGAGASAEIREGIKKELLKLTNK